MGYFLAEPFTDTDSTTITSHTAVTTWTEHPGSSAGNAAKIVSNKLVSDSTVFKMYYASTTPASADYTVEADFTYHTAVGTWYLIGRLDTALFNCVRAQWNPGVGFRIQAVWDDGGSAAASSYYNPTLVAGTTYRLKLVMVGSSFELFIDGTSRATLTDSNVTAAGRVGVATGNAASSSTVGAEIDNLEALDKAQTVTQGLAVEVGGPSEATQGLAVGVLGTVTATQGLAVGVYVQSVVQRQARGSILYFNGASSSGTAADFDAGTVSGGKLSLTSTSTSMAPTTSGARRNIPWPTADNGGGYTYPQLYDASMSALCGYTSADSAYAAVLALVKDASNYYAIRVGKGSGGTSELISCIAGTITVRASAAYGIDISTDGVVKLTHTLDTHDPLATQTGTIKAWVNGNLIGSWTTTTQLRPLIPYVGAPSASGSASANYYKLLNVGSPAGTIRVAGLTGTQAVRVTVSTLSGSVNLDSGTQSGGVATVDTAGYGVSIVEEPLTYSAQVYTDNTFSTVVDDGRFPQTGSLADGSDGDILHYAPTFDVMGTDFVQGYPFYQIGSHSSVVQNPSTGDIFAIAHGNHGSVVALRGTGASHPRVWTSYEIAPAGTLIDQHENTSMVVDSTGLLHIAYGGYYYGSPTTKYRVSSSTWDISAWSSATDLGISGDCMLMVDQADKLHLVGCDDPGGSYQYGAKLVYKSKASGGAWSSTTTLANHYDSGGQTWAFYLGDCSIGKETSGQQSVHFTAWTYLIQDPYSTPVNDKYAQCFYFRSTDGGSTWKNLTGSSYSLPLAQTSGGAMAAAAGPVTASSTYVSRICVDPDNTTVHMIVPVWIDTYDPADGAVKRQYRYYQGNTTTGWAASTYTFPTFQLGAIESINGVISYIAADGLLPPEGSPPSYNGDTPWTLQRFRATASDGSAWSQDEIVAPPGPFGTVVPLYPRLTPIPGSVYVNLSWVQWTNMLQGGGLAYTGTGQSSILTQTVLGAFATTQDLAVAVYAQPTVTQGLAVGVLQPPVTQGLAVGVAAAATTTAGLAVAVTNVTYSVTQGLAVSVDGLPGPGQAKWRIQGRGSRRRLRQIGP